MFARHERPGPGTLFRVLSPALALLALFLAARSASALLRLGAPGRLGEPGRLGAEARSFVAGLGQDLGLALALGLCAAALGLLAARLGARAGALARSIGWSLFGLLALYLALTAPAAAILGSPLTWPMLAGAGTALGDSVRAQIGWANGLAVAAVLATALLLPRALRGAGAARASALILGLALLALAALLGQAVEPPPGGGHRNALVALGETAWRGRALAGARALARAQEDPTGASLASQLPEEGPAVDLRAFAGAARGRNLIWVVLESTGAAYLKPYGAQRDPMPRLSAMAEGGIVFEQAYAVYPESVKGIFSLLCAAETEPYRAASAYAASARPCRDLAALLGDAGYETALYHSGRFAYLGMREILAGRGYKRMVDAGGIGGPHASSFGVDENAAVDRILADLDRRAPNRPFFVHYLPIAGHHPYESPGTGPRPFGERDNFHRYLSDLAMGDAALGRLIDGVAVRGLAEETLWVFSGDHGEAFEQHPGNIAHSLFIYEENMRVPLIVVAPGLTNRIPNSAGAGSPPLRAPQIASLVDVAPTILALLGLDAPPDWQGRSLLAPDPGAAHFYTDHTSWQEGLRHGSWKYILDRDSGRGELFDLAADPGETRDVSPEHPARAARYREHLER